MKKLAALFLCATVGIQTSYAEYATDFSQIPETCAREAQDRIGDYRLGGMTLELSCFENTDVASCNAATLVQDIRDNSRITTDKLAQAAAEHSEVVALKSENFRQMRIEQEVIEKLGASPGHPPVTVDFLAAQKGAKLVVVCHVPSCQGSFCQTISVSNKVRDYERKLRRDKKQFDQAVAFAEEAHVQARLIEKAKADFRVNQQITRARIRSLPATMSAVVLRIAE